MAPVPPWGPHSHDRVTSFRPNYLPRALPSNTITLDIRMSTYEFGGGVDTNIQSVALPLQHRHLQLGISSLATLAVSKAVTWGRCDGYRLQFPPSRSPALPLPYASSVLASFLFFRPEQLSLSRCYSIRPSTEHSPCSPSFKYHCVPITRQDWARCWGYKVKQNRT